MDLNHRPLPYQGSALTELSYRPPVRRDSSPSASVATARKRCQSRGRMTSRGRSEGQGEGLSANVISIPPTMSLMRLYRNATKTLMSDHTTVNTRHPTKIHVKTCLPSILMGVGPYVLVFAPVGPKM